MAQNVQDDSRMTGIYTTYYEMLFNNSIVLANQYTDSGKESGSGSWGLFQFTDMQLNASDKWLGMLAYFQ
jgi:hypothetical protein